MPRQAAEASEPLTCAWCGAPIYRRATSGPVPQYCSPGHRQRAYEARRMGRRPPRVPSPTAVPDVPLLTADEVAGWLRLPKATLENWRWKGIGPKYLRVGRYVRYRRTDVEQWLGGRYGEAEG